jgi:proteasome assembly chaperone (PAC2) family protein
MDHLSLYQKPDINTPYMIIAFAGWPDAGEGATKAVQYILKKVPVNKCAEIDPEEFYDFINLRPLTTLTPEGERSVTWPSNEVHCWTIKEKSEGMLLFLGIEPSLKWKTYANTLVDLAQDNGVKTVIHLGSLVDTVPHTKETQITGSSTSSDIASTLKTLTILPAAYEGPTGIASAVMETCEKANIDYVSLWGHTPHYLQASPNYKVCYALLQRLEQLLDLGIDLDDMKMASEDFDLEIKRAIGEDPQIRAYVRKLEQRYDKIIQDNTPMPEPEEAIRELEKFLKEPPPGNGNHSTGY